MKPRITLITLGVDDLEKSLSFYRGGLGLPMEGIVGNEFEHGAVAFFEMQSGLKLAIWPPTDMAYDAGIPEGACSATEFTIGHNPQQRGSRRCDGPSTKGRRDNNQGSARHFLGGYAGIFQDPDGHLWRVAWNPQWELPD